MALTNDKPSDKVTQPDESEAVEGPKGLWNKILWVQTHATQVAKTGRMDNAAGKYAFMQEHALIELLQPKFAEAGLLVLVDVDQSVREGNSATLQGRMQIIDIDTGDKTVQFFPAEGTDRGDKATPKALTQLTKYALQKTFLIATEKIDDSDNDHSADNPRVTKEPTDKPLTDEQRQRVTQTLLALDEKKRGLVLAAAGVEGEPSTVGQAFKIRELLDADA